MSYFLQRLLRVSNKDFDRKEKKGKGITPGVLGTATCEDRLLHAKGLGFLPRVIYDGGAFIGSWALKVASIFPEAQFVLIEPNFEILPEMESNIASEKHRMVIVRAALSDAPGKTVLNIWDNPKHENRITALAASSLLPHVQGEATKQIHVEAKTLDIIIAETGKIPDLIKLDLQGGELKALQGGAEALQYAEMCIIEFGCLDAYIGRTTPRQIMDIMYDNGFCLYDVVDLRYRPYDGALAGGDFFFVKTSSKLRSHKDYF